MKKLASIALAVGSLAIATPVFACPGMDHDGAETATPKTAEKAPPAKDTTKAAPAPTPAKDQAATAKKADAKPADKAQAKPAKTAQR